MLEDENQKIKEQREYETAKTEKKSIRSQKREDQKESVVTIEKDSLGEEK